MPIISFSPQQMKYPSQLLKVSIKQEGRYTANEGKCPSFRQLQAGQGMQDSSTLKSSPSSQVSWGRISCSNWKKNTTTLWKMPQPSVESTFRDATWNSENSSLYLREAQNF